MTTTTVSVTSRPSSDDIGKLIMRLSIGGMMLFHGIAKIQHGVQPIADMLAGKGLPTMMAYGAYVGEVLAPLLIIVGFLTRPAAAIVMFNMIMAIFLAHSADVLARSPHGGWAIELQMFYLLGALALVFMGSGRLALTRGKGKLD